MSAKKRIKVDSSIVISKVVLPKEMWIQTWAYLDFETLQKKCTRVSKKWFEDIRNSARLSGKLTLKTRTRSKKIDDLSAKDINGILGSWKMLKTLNVPSEIAISQIGINWNEHTLLRKIIVPKRVPVSMKELGNWGKVLQVCYDPKQGWTPITLENIAGLEVKINSPANFLSEGIPNIESLTLVDSESTNGRQASLITNFLASETISSFNLKSLHFKLDYLNSSQLTDVLEIIETKENLDISAIISVDFNPDDRFDSIEEFFEYVSDFIDERLPIESTEFDMKGTYEDYMIQTWNLKKIKGSKTEIEEEIDENACDQCGFDCGQQDDRRHY